MTTNNPNQLPVTTSPWSIVSLISGISSYLVLPFLGGIIALITGYVARREIKSSNGALSCHARGRTTATADQSNAVARQQCPGLTGKLVCGGPWLGAAEDADLWLADG